jgi:hypothetical protein
MIFDFLPPEKPADAITPATIEAADRISRHWASTQVGVLRRGSEAHKREVCRMFRETFNPYRPAVITWPELSTEALQRVKSLPIWDIAVHTEGRARMRFAAYAGTLADPDMRDAIMLNAWEENRHKEVLSKMVEAYGIKLADEPPLSPPRDSDCSTLPGDPAFFRPSWWRRSSRSSKRNVATSCFLPIGWRGIARTCRGGVGPISSFASPPCGSTSPGCASDWPATWTRTVTPRTRTATSP